MIWYLFNSIIKYFSSNKKFQKITYWFDERLSTIRPFAFSISFGNACKLLWLRSSIDKSGLSNNLADICVCDTWLSRIDNERNDGKSFKHNGTSGKLLCAKLNFSYNEKNFFK